MEDPALAHLLAPEASHRAVSDDVSDVSADYRRLRPAGRASVRRRAFLAGGLGLAGAAAASHHFAAPATGGPLYVRRSGTGGPWVLCLHGLFASGAFWTRLAASLGSGYRLVMPDLVGFGRSPQPEADYSENFHLDWIAPLLEGAGEWTVLGHSMGCALALGAGRRWPDRVRRIQLFNAPVYSSEANRRAIFARQSLLTRVSVRSPRLARWVCEATVCAPRPLLTRIAPFLRPDVPPESASDYFRHTYTSYSTSFARLVLERDLLDELRHAAQPVEVVQGSDDGIVEAAARLPWPDNVTLRIEPGDHTSLLLGRPARAAALLRGFLEATGMRKERPP